MESALVVMGTSIIRSGKEIEEGAADEEKLISLLLIIGQYLDLSVMGRISRDQDLDPGSYLDEIIMVFEHDIILFRMLKGLEHGDDPERKTTIARAMKLYVK